MGTFGRGSQDALRAQLPHSGGGELFERFPFGLFTVDESGHVLDLNDACRKMLLRDADPPSHPLSCCELICQRLTEAESPQCLTRAAMSAGKALPEVRVDLLNEAADAVWVTVSPLGNGQAVFHLRPGKAGDRRRRSEAQWEDTVRMRIFVLGPTRVETSLTGSIGGPWLEQRAGQVLKFLVCSRGRIASVEEVGQALWPDAGAEALNSVRYFIHALRARLEPAREARAPSRFIESRRGGYRLDTQHVWLDVAEFEQQVGAGLAALAAREPAAARQRLERAMNLYRDDLLTDEPYAEWALAERNRLRELAARTLTALVELQVASGDLTAATRHARHLADLEPYDSDAQRRHIELSLRRGRRSEAMRRYDMFRRRLQRDFNQEPDFTLADLTTAAGGGVSSYRQGAERFRGVPSPESERRPGS